MEKPVMPDLSLLSSESEDDPLHAHTPTRIAAALRDHICKGALSPGTKLSEEMIAAEFEVSRNTLREAFTVLAGEDLVYKVPNRGVFVIDPGPHDIREIYQTRRFIEPSAILWGKLTPELTETFHHIADRTRRGVAQEDFSAIVEADRSFHVAVVALAGSETMSQALERLLTRLRLAFTGLRISTPIHGTFAQQNLAIITRILGGERIEASRGLHRYLGLAENMIMQHVTGAGQPATDRKQPVDPLNDGREIHQN
ncbi:MAG TPA: GntR family transcriptional regulator [Enteractinococcus helveticum]|uniref:GntR family transcriptional regulator n=1 Tax=Enteractinococcus helveticum TaxID=1837282 RepID=A0A921FMF2_9MICC|nr:GntR family transcriptional regulator [Enteractinococcus helveticum]HJF14778.1 GntR family transcriptional regulator [Enteractinococcus helveticum]